MAIAETNGPVFRAPAIDVRGVFFFAGVIVCLLGAAMLVPAIVDLADNNDDYLVFLTCSVITLFGGLSSTLAFRHHIYSMGCAR